MIKQACLLSGIFAFAAAVATAAENPPAAPNLEPILKAVGFDAGAKDKVLAGEIISKNLAEGSDKELAAVIAFRIRAPLSKVMEAAHSGKTLSVEREILAFGKADTLEKLGYAPDEAGEAFTVLNVGPGSKLNFSSGEIERWRALKAKLKGADPRKDPQALAAVNAEYRSLLADRLAAYQKGGISAIAPYSRGKTDAKPADELSLASRESAIGKAFPEFEQAMIKYPAAGTDSLEHEYLWIKQRIEKRPVMILAHRMYLQGADYVVAMERQIYVGASYNSQQAVTGGRPAGDVVLALYGNRCFTDQVAGAMSGMKHGIGRGQMIDELKAHFERVRKVLEQ